MEARTVTEENLAGLAAQRASVLEIARIDKAVQQMRDSIATKASILKVDMSFHLAIAAAAQWRTAERRAITAKMSCDRGSITRY